MVDKMQLPAGVRTFEWCGARVYLIEDIQEVAMVEYYIPEKCHK